MDLHDKDSHLLCMGSPLATTKQKIEFIFPNQPFMGEGFQAYDIQLRHLSSKGPLLRKKTARVFHRNLTCFTFEKQIDGATYRSSSPDWHRVFVFF